jgi:hypothetical protein
MLTVRRKGHLSFRAIGRAHGMLMFVIQHQPHRAGTGPSGLLCPSLFGASAGVYSARMQASRH